MRYSFVLGVTCVCLAVAIGLDQYRSIGQFFQLHDALHHEFFMAVFGAFGGGLLVGTLLTKE
ncbi:hypothetical protein MUP77_06235 [Candidatus Bathyarchaeota archaeon]|nr:hypothetical protein [Candidatus Bathyarchaeota archaeon]